MRGVRGDAGNIKKGHSNLSLCATRHPGPETHVKMACIHSWVPFLYGEANALAQMKAER